MPWASRVERLAPPRAVAVSMTARWPPLGCSTVNPVSAEAWVVFSVTVPLSVRLAWVTPWLCRAANTVGPRLAAVSETLTAPPPELVKLRAVAWARVTLREPESLTLKLVKPAPCSAATVAAVMAAAVSETWK